jgi:site-specific DNA-methyltransferase (adenine-specific)
MSKTSEWETPDEFYKKLDDEFRFTLDPCATNKNHKCQKYYTKDDDGLSKNWEGERVFCNPPYGREIRKWVYKSLSEVCHGCELVVMLIPARTDTKWFHNYVYGKSEIMFVQGRLKFGCSKNSAPFPSMVVVYHRKHLPPYFCVPRYDHDKRLT